MSTVLRVHTHTTRVVEQWCFYVNSWVHTTNNYHNYQLHQQSFFSRLILIPFCRLCKAKRWALCEGQKSFIHEMRRSLSMFEYLHSSSYTNCYWGGSKMFCAMLWCWICCYPALARSLHGESLTAGIVCCLLILFVVIQRSQGLFMKRASQLILFVCPSGHTEPQTESSHYELSQYQRKGEPVFQSKVVL